MYLAVVVLLSNWTSNSEKNFFFCSTVVCIRSVMLKDTSSRLWKALYLPEDQCHYPLDTGRKLNVHKTFNLRLVCRGEDSTFLSSFSNLITFSQSFRLENFRIVLSLNLLTRWHDSILSLVISTPISCRTLQ